MKNIAITRALCGVASAAKIAPLVALAVLSVGIATISGNARAETKNPQVATAVAASIYLDASPRIHASKYRYASRYGVYNAPRLVLPAPNTIQEFADEDDDENEHDDFERADLNDDGFLSLREARRSQPEWARDFRRIDASGDGFLTREEIDAFYRR